MRECEFHAVRNVQVAGSLVVFYIDVDVGFGFFGKFLIGDVHPARAVLGIEGIINHAVFCVAHHWRSDGTTVDASLWSSCHAEEVGRIVGHTAFKVVTGVSVVAQRNEAVAIYLGEFVDGQVSERTVLATLAGVLFQYDALGGSESKVFDACYKHVAQAAQLDADAEVVHRTDGQRQRFAEGKFIFVVHFQREAAFGNLVNHIVVGIEQLELDVAIGFRTVLHGDGTLDLLALFGHYRFGQGECDGEVLVVNHLDVGDEHGTLVLVLIDKGNVDVLACIFVEFE